MVGCFFSVSPPVCRHSIGASKLNTKLKRKKLTMLMNNWVSFTMEGCAMKLMLLPSGTLDSWNELHFLEMRSMALFTYGKINVDAIHKMEHKWKTKPKWFTQERFACSSFLFVCCSHETHHYQSLAPFELIDIHIIMRERNCVHFEREGGRQRVRTCDAQ